MGFLGLGCKIIRGWRAKIMKNGQKTGSGKVFSDPPGRGVLRFLARAYRRPVHFLGFFAVFSEILQI